MRDPKQIVAQGYDRVWRAYEAWEPGDADPRGRWLDRVLPLLPGRGAALDLGCGTGAHATRRLVELFTSVTAVDISPASVEAARATVPSAELVVADMCALELPSGSFDLIAAFYSVIHVPRLEQPGLVADIASWLRPGGVVVLNLGAGGDDGYEDDWLGAPMYWSAWDAATSRRMIEDAGLDLVLAEEETTNEHGEEVTFLWIAARRPSSPQRGDTFPP